ncbi:MAG TPA: adenylate/guanylate cyclase domain-containing protein [Magnetospirillaceae bacterium]
MAPLSVTTYEVYLIDGGRWVLHARYRRDEREKAIEEAKTIERELATSVKVSREVYNSSENTSEETTVYATDKPPPRKPAAPRGGLARGGGGGGFDDFGGGGGGRAAATAGVSRGAIAARQQANASAAQGTIGALGRMVLVIVGSLIGAVVVTMVASFVLQKSAWMQLHYSYLGPLQFVIFITSFLIIAIPLASRKVRWAGFTDRAPSAPAPRKSAKAKAPPKPKKKAEEEPKDEEDTLADVLDDPLPEEEKKPEEPVAEEKPTEEPAEESAGVAVEMQRGTMGKFTQGLLSEVQKSRPQLDAYNRFGVSLMLAGAVDVVGDKNGLEAEQRRELLASALTDMGTRKDAAKSFSAKYEEYMTEKRYLGMVQAGRVAAESFIENPAMPLPPMKALFDAWGKPQSAEAAPRIMAVMFTDMVGSTDMTQVKGDQAAQVIVRRHNSIVRAALNEYGGKQVKHTGDGIMASFPSPASAVEATIAIQRACAANNARFPDQELHLRIGINAGEPIQEEEDLFGATVQLAARVCAAAGTDQIVCTNVVRELSGGKANFRSRGPVALKGFSEKITLYDVAWT